MNFTIYHTNGNLTPVGYAARALVIKGVAAALHYGRAITPLAQSFALQCGVFGVAHMIGADILMRVTPKNLPTIPKLIVTNLVSGAALAAIFAIACKAGLIAAAINLPVIALVVLANAAFSVGCYVFFKPTPISVEKPIQEATNQIAQFKAIVANTSDDMASKKAHLVKANDALVAVWKQCDDPTCPPKELALCMAEVRTLYGQLFYNDTNYQDHFGLTRQILLQSLNLQHYAIGLSSECLDMTLPEHSDLAKQPDQIAHAKPFESMHQAILDTPADKLMKHVTDAKLNSHQRYVLAYTYRWIGGCVNNIDNGLKTEKVLSNILNPALKLLTVDAAPDAETTAELDELEYNDLVSYYGNVLKDQAARDATWEKLIKKSEAANNFGRLATIYNKRHFEYPETDLVNKEKSLRKALEYRQKCPNTSMGEKFHLALIQNNLAVVLEKKEPKDWDETQTLREANRAFVIEAKAKGWTHTYLPGFNKRYVEHLHMDAESKIASKDFAGAQALLEKTQEVMKEDTLNNAELTAKTEQLLTQCK